MSRRKRGRPRKERKPKVKNVILIFTKNKEDNTIEYFSKAIGLQQASLMTGVAMSSISSNMSWRNKNVKNFVFIRIPEDAVKEVEKLKEIAQEHINLKKISTSSYVNMRVRKDEEDS